MPRSFLSSVHPKGATRTACTATDESVRATPGKAPSATPSMQRAPRRSDSFTLAPSLSNLPDEARAKAFVGKAETDRNSWSEVGGTLRIDFFNPDAVLKIRLGDDQLYLRVSCSGRALCTVLFQGADTRKLFIDRTKRDLPWRHILQLMVRRAYAAVDGKRYWGIPANVAEIIRQARDLDSWLVSPRTTTTYVADPDILEPKVFRPRYRKLGPRYRKQHSR